MQTLESYEQEPHQSSWWKRSLGTALSFAGLVLLTNAFIVLVPFGHLLPLWGEVAFSVIGGTIGAIGLKLRGHRGDNLVEPIVLVIAGIIANVVVSLLSEQFGMIGLVVIIGLFYIYETQISWRIEGPE